MPRACDRPCARPAPQQYIALDGQDRHANVSHFSRDWHKAAPLGLRPAPGLDPLTLSTKCCRNVQHMHCTLLHGTGHIVVVAIHHEPLPSSLLEKFTEHHSLEVMNSVRKRISPGKPDDGCRMTPEHELPGRAVHGIARHCANLPAHGYESKNWMIR